MKRIMKALFVGLVLMSALGSLAGSCFAVGRPQATDPVQTIRQQYAAINKRVRRYKTVKKELSGFSLEGGQLIAYFDGPAIVKIVANHYGEGGKSVEEYYYANAKLIFIYRKDFTYNRPLSGKVIKTQENRFYFQGDRLIKWINEEGKPIAPGSAEAQEKQDEYLQASSKFLDGARSKAATIEAE